MIVGVLYFLENLGLLQVGGSVVPLIFAFGGLSFLYVFLTSHTSWWAIIPASALLGLAALIAWEQFGPDSAESWGPALFLAALSVSFWVVYLGNRDAWWATIPGGVLLTLALVVGLSPVLEGTTGVGGVFFLGLAATFLVLSLVSTSEGRLRWALIPAGVMSLLGLFLILAALGLAVYGGPALLMLVGAYFIARSLVTRRGAE
jgi:hypothetical protein